MSNSERRELNPPSSHRSKSSQPSSKRAASRFAVPVGIAASLLISTGIGLHLFQPSTPLASNQQLKSEVTTSHSTAMPSDDRPQRIEFPPGEISAVVPGNLQDHNTQLYTIEAAQGQIMTVTVQGTAVVMNLLRANKQPIESSAYQTRSWTGQLPADEQYTIEVTGSGAYSIDVAITPVSQFDGSDTQQVRFPRDKTSTTVTGESSPKKGRRYLLKARRRQIMAARVLKGDVSLAAIAPNGQRVEGNSTNSRNWQGRLLIDGEYVIEVSSKKKEDFVLSFEIY